jgi:arylsulfatase A-like enzyme
VHRPSCRRRVRVIGLLSLYAGMCVMAISACDSASGARRPVFGALSDWNVVLLTLDTVDPSRLGMYGGATNVTPYLDSLGAKGLVVERAYCTTGATAPSHASILTSLPPEKHGLFYNGLAMHEGLWNLPSHLQAAGYHTFGWSYAFFQDEHRGFGRGFDRYFAPDISDTSFRDNRTCVVGVKGMLAETKLEEPFFAWVHVKGGHAPVVPIREDYLRRHDGKGEANALPDPPEWHRFLPPQDDDPYLAELRRYYDAQLSEMDDAVREIVAHFSSSRKNHPTLFVFAADHGESFDHGFMHQHWPSPYESTMRIPLVLWADGGTALPVGSRMKDRLVSTMDIAPSLLWLLGLSEGYPTDADGSNIFGDSPRSRIQGSSVTAYALDDQLQRLSEALSRGDSSAADKFRGQADRLISDGHVFYLLLKLSEENGLSKLIYRGAGQRLLWLNAPVLQLFELESDPFERTDLARQMRPAGRPRALLDELRGLRPLAGLTAAGIQPGWRPPSLTTGSGTAGDTLNAELRKRLKSLGYL